MQNDSLDEKNDLGDKEKNKPGKQPSGIKEGTSHLGSSNAFEETENPGSNDPDGISDEMLDELLDEQAKS